MTFELLAQLAVLALIDSTSFGTLLIPIWFLLTPGRVRAGRVLVFLGTVAGFYLLLGIALVAGAHAVLGRAGELLDNPVVAVLQTALGVTLFLWSFRMGNAPDDRRPADVAARASSGEAGAAGDGPTAAEGSADGEPRTGRIWRWRERAMGSDDVGVGPLIGLALAAAAVETASMLPYLAAVGLLSTSELAFPGRAGVLAGYCLVMVLPALVLLAGRVVAGRVVEPMLGRVAGWMERQGAETTAWIVGIVGFLMARDGLVRIPGLIEALDAIGRVQ